MQITRHRTQLYTLELMHMDTPKIVDAYFILKNIGRTERKRVKQLSIAFADENKRATSKTRQLLNELAACELIPNPAAFRKTHFPGASSNNFQWIQKHAVDTILDYISSDRHLAEDASELPDSFRAKMRARKLLIQFEMTATYGGRSTALRLLQEAIAIADKYQHYHELYSALYYMLSVVTTKGE